MRVEKNDIQSGFCSPLFKLSLVLFFASVLSACGGGGGGGGGGGNNAPAFTSGAALSVAENTTAVTTVTATDADGEVPTFSISGATADDALFSITTGGVLTFLAAPNFEAPADIGADNVYDVEVTADDGVGGTTIQNIAVTVTDVSEIPVITSSAVPSVAENNTAVITVIATDDDGDTPTFSITGVTADDALFSITAGGVLTFDAAPDFEAPGDIGTDNVYDIEVTADDGNSGLTTQNITVTVTNINEGSPIITSSASPSVAENTSAVTTVTATDVDINDTVTFSITGVTADDALFSITTGGVLTFDAAPDFETPGDLGTNNVYDIEVTADDGNGGLTAQNITVAVTNINEGSPIITSGAAPSVAENTVAVTVVTAMDVDINDTVTFSIVGATADDALFSITTAGVLTFMVAPNFETPSDIGGNNIYNITVAANDGNGGVTPQALAVTVANVNEGSPVITSSATPSVVENVTAVTTVTATDVDTSDTLTFSITGSADDGLFSITTGGVLTFIAAPDFETPSDIGADNIYNLTVTVDDGNTGLTPQAITVTVTNTNDGSPVITSSATPSVVENTTAVTTVTATDVDTGDTVTFSITGATADDALFSITTGGVLTFLAAPDFETPGDIGGDNIYNVEVTADDGNTGLTSQAITVTVTNVNEGSPVITSSATPSVAENISVVTTVTATDVDTNDTVTFSITGATADDALFSITTAGVLSFLVAPDFETPGDIGTDNVYNITVTADDGNTGVTPQAITVTVTNINEGSPVITSSATPSVVENTTTVLTVTATDVDTSDTVTFSITGVTADDALFSITAGGVLTFMAAPDFEMPGDIGGNNVYDIEVTADDGNSGTTVQNIAVTVTDINEAPVITSSAAASVPENTTAVTTVTATDVDVDAVTFSITGVTADDALFSITAGGVLTFIAAPDFEAPGDIGTDNVYDIEVTADDGNGGTVAQNIAVTVTNVNNTPVAVDDSATVIEKRTVNIDLASNDTADAIDLTSIAIISAPTSATSLVINPDGTVDYTHNGTNTTSDSFTYTIDDADSGLPSNTVTVSITVLQGFNEAMFATPSVSSSTAAIRVSQASDGLSGDTNNGWEATSIVDGEYIQLDFDSTKSIYRVYLLDLVSATNQVTSATVLFSNGDSIGVGALPDDGTLSPTANVNDFYFTPKQVDWIRVTLHTAKGGSTNLGLSEFTAFSSLDPGQSTVQTERFNGSLENAWTIVDDCLKAGSISSWAVVNNRYEQSGDCRGFSAADADGVEHGTYPILDAVNITDMDLRLRIKSDGAPVGDWRNGAMGVLFAYRSLSDYYRLDISQQEGHTKLWKRIGGVFTELATSPVSLVPNSTTDIRIVRVTTGTNKNVIVVYKDDVKIMAVEDVAVPLNNGDYQIGLLCARNKNCVFDSLVLLSGTSTPIVGANIDDDGVGEHTSGEYFVDTNGNLDINAVVTDDSAVTEIEFVVDEGTGSDVTVTDTDGYPYTANFNSLSTGDHTVNVYLRDGSGRLSGVNATEELPVVGVSGLFLVGLGDSIVAGLRDDVSSDDTSLDGRNSSGGFQPVLNDLLTADNSGLPVTVLNEANAGELSSQAAARIAAVLARTPEAQGYLATYGANDSNDLIASGLGETCTDYSTFTGCTGTYIGSFKHNMQQIINAVLAAGKVIYLSKTPPYVPGGARDTLIQAYNDVIDELIALPVNGFSLYTPPDFHTYFTANSGTHMYDTLHPNGIGYQEMAKQWCTALNGQAGIVCAP